MPAFSVVMATYNRGRHILPSIRSVLDQGFRDFELLVVGDCCTDETEDVVRPFLSERVRWINLPERCGSQSFPNNEGIARSSGRHIAYIGHDDIWDPDHLETLAALLEAEPQPDFAVGGAIFYGPPESDFRQVTGIFTDERAPFEHFFPPSSFAHRRDVTDRIGPWPHPLEVSAPVDADLLLRAANAGLRFASTQRVTVHKFAAGHRYLSYLAHSSDEQEGMIRRMGAPGYAAFVRAEIDGAKAQNTFMGIGHPAFDTFAKGHFARIGAVAKGNSRPELRELTRRETIIQDNPPRALDWQLFRRADDRIRWVGRNPRPKILLPFTSKRPVEIELTLAHATSEALGRLDVLVNGRPTPVAMSRPRPGDGGVREATATLGTRLETDGYTIVELRLEGRQRMSAAEDGIGLAEIALEPMGVRGRAGRLWSRLARRGAPAS